MRVTTKINMFGTLVALIAVFAAFQIATGNIVTDRNDDDFSVSSKWEPGVLSPQNPVKIVVTVDGFALPARFRHVSPYHENMTVARGAKVVVRAETKHPSVHNLDCFILVNGLVVPHTGFDSRTGPGAVQCWVQTKVI